MAVVERWRDLYRLVLEKHHQHNMATRHIAVETWLEALGLMEYVTCFTQYNGVENLLYMSEAEIKELGVKNAAHRAKIVSSLRILREKYERSTLPGKKNSPLQHVQRSQSVTAQLSPSWSPPSLLTSPDYQQVNVSPEKLQHDLIVELQGDPADLKSKAWYHGSISRQRAERLVFKNGDFLVRDCISQPGDFVLTCCWKGGPLHFVINSSVIDQGPYKLPKVTYHFEATHFNSVQDLIQFYMDECKQITEITGAVITTPIGRSMPLTYYDSKYGALAALSNAQANHYSAVHHPNQPPAMPAGQNHVYQRSPLVTPGTSPRSSPQGTPGVSPHGTPGTSPHGSPKSDRRQRFGERSGSQPLLSVNDIPVYVPPAMDRSDSLPVITGVYKQVTPTQEPAEALLPGDNGIYKTVTPVTTVYTPPSQPRAPPVYIHQRSGSAPVLTPGVTVTQHFDSLAPPRSLNPASSDSDLSKAPPPKPSRIPSVKYKKKPQVQIRNVALYEDDYRDYSDYSQVTSEPSWLKSEAPNQQTEKFKQSNQMHGDNIYDNNFNQSKNVPQERDLNQNLEVRTDSRKISDTQFNILDGDMHSDVPAFPLELNLNRDQIRTKQQDTVDYSTSGRRQGIHLTHIPSQTQNSSHKKIKIPKIETGPSFNLNSYVSVILPNENKLLEPSALINIREKLLKTNAKELALYLTKVDLEMLKVLNEEDLGVKVTSGLELITLPQGKQLRQDILERIYSLKAFVMVMILTCPKVIDRASMLSQWIQIAMETKGTLGNLFGFENVMEGLMSEQIQRLRDTWMVLRQSHTGSAFLFDTKLKSAFRTLHDGSGSLPVQDICIPGINPIVQLLERTLDDESYFPWESSDINNGLDTMLIHLDLARVVTAQCGVYRVTGNALTKDLEQDQEKMEVFQTEFHLRFLWGFKGAGVARSERHNKFNMLLTAYSEKIEKEGDDGTAV
ncbi:breast cancer anti-estrogen resistance protein 3 homolog isoform X2 [Mercenaria mercenaria]|uniref:breast cancer anti-estrogen resistance protein 3 homolog isoform X2 n=1 Tax=Mercenaria mercenaria TaxID=6596 RepID=UPI00234EE536|nr:breast cancer anti-estrogen resistance protein 3 homolog isoform X2 [Mercenaria mercenaria]